MTKDDVAVLRHRYRMVSRALSRLVGAVKAYETVSPCKDGKCATCAELDEELKWSMAVLSETSSQDDVQKVGE